MVDNIDVTPGSGKTVRTDDVSGAQEQIIKIALGLDGVEDTLLDSGQQLMAASVPVVIASNQTAIPVNDNAGSITVDVGAGENHLGAIGGHMVNIIVVPTLTVAATYVTNDYVGTSGDAMTFANAARINAGTGIIVSAVLVDYALQSVMGELWLFDTEPTPPADSAAWTITDAHAARCIGVIPFNTYYPSALNSVAPVGNLTIAFQCAAASRDLYGCFVTRGAPVYATGNLTFRLYIIQD
jgi:hypothetical protein